MLRRLSRLLLRLLARSQVRPLARIRPAGIDRGLLYTVRQSDLRRHHHPSAAPGSGTIGPALAAAPAIAAFSEYRVVGVRSCPLLQRADGAGHAVLGLVVGL